MPSLLALPAALLLAAAPGASTSGVVPSGIAAAGPILASVPVCPGPVAEGDVRCHSRVRLDESAQPFASASPSGYGPSDLQSAYGLPSATAGAGQTIAIVDAYDDPNAESDLGVYRSHFGLSPCTTANGCFRKVDQSGGTSYPRLDRGWSLEISLDVQMASAICPNCKILLVEAASSGFSDLTAAVDTAARLGANVISNSYGGAEFSGETSWESHYDHPGVAITVSSGDGGYGVEFPAASRYVTAVGGTTLSRAAVTASNPRGWTETAWTGAGSGCSAYVAKPSWQADPGCANRTVADVSADADPNTGVAVYDSVRYQGRSGWFVVGGTSLSSPVIASIYALAGNAANVTAGSYPYANAASLFDVVAGSNGTCSSSAAYLCTAGPGYDGPTGLGTPDGTGAF